jgi:hypothetical protein
MKRIILTSCSIIGSNFDEKMGYFEVKDGNKK